MSKTDTEPTAPTDPIVLETKLAYASIGAEIDGEQRVIELPQPDDAERDRQEFTVPAADTDLAYALLRQHKHVSVVSNPTDRDLTNILTPREEKLNERLQAESRRQEQKRKNAAFDPVEETPYNKNTSSIVRGYEHLTETGHEEKARELRELDSKHKQKQYLFAARDAGLFDDAHPSVL